MNAPLLPPSAEWSRKAPLRRGGTVPQWIGKPPKWIITPYRAFVMEQVRSLLRVDPDAKLLPCALLCPRCRCQTVYQRAKTVLCSRPPTSVHGGVDLPKSIVDASVLGA